MEPPGTSGDIGRLRKTYPWILWDTLGFQRISQECLGMDRGQGSRNYSSGPPYRLCAWDLSTAFLGRIPQDPRRTRDIIPGYPGIPQKSLGDPGSAWAIPGIPKVYQGLSEYSWVSRESLGQYGLSLDESGQQFNRHRIRFPKST